MLPRQLEGAEHDASESTHEASESSVGGIDHINVDQLRTALCAFLGIEEGGANTEFLNRYIQTFCAASAVMGEANTFGNILGQSEDEFHNTLQICRLISEQFEIEISTQQQRLAAATEDDMENEVTIIPPAREAAINGLPFERILPADRLNFQHDKTCCPICFEPLIEGLVVTRRRYQVAWDVGFSPLVQVLTRYTFVAQSLAAICITRTAPLLGCLGVVRVQNVGTSFRRPWVPSTRRIAVGA